MLTLPAVHPPRIGSLCALLTLVACKSPEQREAARVQTALSWVATAGTVAKGWTENRLPARYAERVLDDAGTELTANDEANAARIVGSLRDAVRRRDRDGAIRVVAELGGEWNALRERSTQVQQRNGR